MSGFNPFAALVGEGNSNESETNSVSRKQETSLENNLEDIFSFTLNPKHAENKELLLLEDIRKINNQSVLTLDILSHALFDRVFMCNSENVHLVNCVQRNYTDRHTYEHRPIIYLYTAFCRITVNEFLNENEKELLKDMVVQNTATAIIQPEIYDGQNLEEQMIEVLKEGSSVAESFLRDASKRVLLDENDNDEKLRLFMGNMVKSLRTEIIKSQLVNFNFDILNCIKIFTSDEILADIFLDLNQPQRSNIGSDYANTILGGLFNIHLLPKVPNGKYEYFSEPMDNASVSQMEGILWSSIEKINDQIHSILLSFLKCSPKIKDKLLSWLGKCLKANVDRGKLWNSQAPAEFNPANYTNVTDGFMISLSNVLLRLCQPFCHHFKDKKILKVDPTYCSVPNDKLQEKGIHMVDLFEETSFIPIESSEEERLSTNNYNFVTEIFFMTHKAIDLGFRVVVDKLIRLTHETSRIERAFNDAVQQAGGNSDVLETIKDRMKGELTKYLSIKQQLSDPILTKLLIDFISASTYWLSQIAVHCDLNDKGENFAPLNELPITFPLSNEIPNTLKCIPEFLVENIVTYLVFLRRFCPKVFEEQGYEKLEPILTFILIYMGSQNHLKNPHVRARLAEGLESLLPHHKDDPPQLSQVGGFQRELLFTSHPHKLHIVENVLHVFVGIEMTGQSVEFEQKFNYRRPMYLVIEHLWEMEDHMNCFKKLAEDAEQNMEAVNPPLFLRFANLLMNDAIFLLDEALANMAKIKEMQQARDNGEWNQLSERERTQNISYMHHTGMIARFDNILGRDTITTLDKLTSKITKVFTHSTMVDRVASMLNYFLLNLVGPNKKNFKVKDSKEYSFEPATTVLGICKIYINLKSSDAFCLAISQDGRSYSPTLFPLAEDVLARIGGGTLIGELQELAAIVAEKAEQYKANEEAISEAPEHYLDPIMSTLMTDPVILPSSRQTVDRTTIARHLLSDQTDPFNRSPLSMDQVIPNEELAAEIKEWLAERMK